MRKRKDFLQEELSKVDISDCFSDCSTCLVNIGSFPAFIKRFEPLYQQNGYSMDEIDSVYVRNLYQEQLNVCQQRMRGAGCQRSPCDEKLDIIKSDVSPGGQYARYDTTNYALLEPGLNILSRYREISLYTNEYGNPDSVLIQNNDNEGIKVPVRDLSLTDFIRYFRKPWADSLARLHPEYCYYLWCLKQSTSYAFDKTLTEKITSGKEAEALGYYNRNDYRALLFKDPYFDPSNWPGGNVALRRSMRKAMSVFSRSMAGLSMPDKNILQFVDITLYCSQKADGWVNCSIDTACRSIDREWELYKEFYLQLKQRFYEEGRQSDASFVGCNNCYIGTDIAGMLNGNGNAAAVTGGKIGTGFAASIIEEPVLPVDGGGGGIGGGGTGGGTGGNTGAGPKLFPPSPCINECPPGEYTDGVRSAESVSYYIVKGVPNVYPTGVPVGYSNCRFYAAFHFINAQTLATCTLFNVWVCVRKTSEIFDFFGPLTPKSSCKGDPRSLLYANKLRRYMDYTNMSGTISNLLGGNPIAVAEGKKDTLQRNMCTLYAAAKADSWIHELRDCSTDSVKLELLRQAFLEIGTKACMLYGNLESFSSIPDSIQISYHSLEAAITGILGNTSANQGCSVDFLSSAYSHLNRPITHLPTIKETSFDICSRLDSLNNAYQAVGYAGSFHGWLKQEMGTAFRLNEKELNNLISSCTSCGGLLKESLLLPLPLMNRLTNINCTEADSLKRLFEATYATLNETHEKYTTVFTNFLNRRLGFGLQYDNYESFFKGCAIGVRNRLYDDVIMPPDSLEADNSCIETLFNRAAQNADQRYNQYIDSVGITFRNNWLTACAKGRPSLRMEADLYEYHYTLYYYDQSGNLVKTVPPSGCAAIG